MSETQHIVCPHCQTQNRVPAARVGDGPKCGQCHRPLFEGHPVELHAGAFDRHLQNSDIPLVVDFWAPWCGPCQVMAPQFEQAAKRLEPRVRLGKIDTEAEQALGARFGIRSIPTMKIFHQGREVASQAGAMDANSIVSWVEASIR